MVVSSQRFRSWLRHRKIAFDTSFLIPILEDVGEGRPLVTRILGLAQKRSISLVTSTTTLLEILVHPYRRREMEKVQRYYGYLTSPSFVKLEPLSADIADQAAELRAKYGFKTPDSIQLATAIDQKATLFLTRDRAFGKQDEIQVGIL